MPKSDDTRYASEIPAVLAWDPEYTDSEIERAKAIAFATRQAEYDLNCDKALRHRELIQADMKRRGFAPVEKISWQANFNRNNNGSPADVVFEDHAVGGVSVKDGSDIIGNFGTKDFDTDIERPRGEDLFRHLATAEFDALIQRVKQDLISELDVGATWTEDRELDHGKYAITRVDEDKFQLKFGSTRKTVTTAELIEESFINSKGLEKKLPGKWRRVFGDYYQDRKKKYQTERLALFNVLYPIIVNLCEKIVIADPEKLCQIGGFTEKPYYVSDLRKDKIYFVQPKADVLNKIQVEIYNKDKDRSFGSGFELGCKIKLVDSLEFATLDFYVCYNSGTFNRGPVIKIQSFTNKEKLWTKVN
jgi:hypothetical protein